jgi:glycosyltransferase involved in cell wall biosynthesis
MLDLAVIILTKDEEIHIERCLRAIHGFAHEIFVVDSFSRDRTVELARALGALVIQHQFINYATQFQWALDNLPIQSQWIMRLDADEVIGRELGREIRDKIPMMPPHVTGVMLKRELRFMHKLIRFGGRRLRLLRIFRRGYARIEKRWMDEHMLLRCGEVVTFRESFCDYNLQPLPFFIDKHNHYATREAIDVILSEKVLPEDTGESLRDLKDRRIIFKRKTKVRIFYGLPLFSGPIIYFFYRYVVLLGLLDGSKGLIYHFMQGFWYRFLVQVKLIELRTALGEERDRTLIMQRLRQLTGLNVTFDPATEAAQEVMDTRCRADEAKVVTSTQ